MELIMQLELQWNYRPIIFGLLINYSINRMWITIFHTWQIHFGCKFYIVPTVCYILAEEAITSRGRFIPKVQGVDCTSKRTQRKLCKNIFHILDNSRTTAMKTRSDSSFLLLRMFLWGGQAPPGSSMSVPGERAHLLYHYKVSSRAGYVFFSGRTINFLLCSASKQHRNDIVKLLVYFGLYRNRIFVQFLQSRT